MYKNIPPFSADSLGLSRHFIGDSKTWQFFVTFLGWLSDPFKGLWVTSNYRGWKGHELNHLGMFFFFFSCLLVWQFVASGCVFPIFAASGLWRQKTHPWKGRKGQDSEEPGDQLIANTLVTPYGCFPKNRGFSPQIIHLNRVFTYKPSILGYPYFWKHPYMLV